MGGGGHMMGGHVGGTHSSFSHSAGRGPSVASSGRSVAHNGNFRNGRGGIGYGGVGYGYGYGYGYGDCLGLPPYLHQECIAGYY